MYQVPRVPWLVALICSLWVIPAQAQFVAFNDHAPGSGTHANTTTWSCLVAPTAGLLKNITNGTDTTVTLNITRTGTGTAVGASAAAYPQVGTPAYLAFTNYVDFVGTPGAAVQISNITVHYTFTGLNPSKRYNFKGSAVRGGNGGNYTNRWTKIAISGADSFDSQHTANVVTSSQQPTLTPNEAAINFGVNLSGDMVVWDQIDPGADGTFEILCDFYRGPLPAPNSATLNAPPHCYAITAIRLEEFSSVTTPIFVTGVNPSATNIMQGGTATFDVSLIGSNPRFRWYRGDGQPINHAISINSKTLTITNAQPSDGQPTAYFVEVTNSVSSSVGGPATLTVQPDVTPPAIVSALAYLNGSNFVVSFSERLDATAPNANGIHIHLLGGQGELPVTSVATADETNILVSTSSARSPFGNYEITIDAQTVFDANGNAYPGGTTPFLMEFGLLTFNNTPWKYNADGIDLGTSFYDPAYDDSSWPNGLSVFDVLRPQPPGRSTVAGFPVATQLPLTNALYETTIGVIPTYYYRTSFRLPTGKAHIRSLQLYTLVDDFDEFFLNGQKAYQSAGYPATNPPPAFGYSGGTAVSIASVLGPFPINLGLLSDQNLGAVIVNQVNGGSSDSTFAYQLVATVDHLDSAPALAITRDDVARTITLTWPSGTGARLFDATKPDASANEWAVVFGASDGSFTFTVPFDVGAMRFFSLRR